MFMQLFDDKRVLTACIAMWTIASSITFYLIMLYDNSPFLAFGPNEKTKLMGVILNTWGKWWCVAIYTFVSTCIAAFASDAIGPWITNTIQDHKTMYIPYSKFMCLTIIQTFTVYAVIMSVIGMFVALTQIDFMLIRISADLMVNHFTTYWFLRGKQTNPMRYRIWLKAQEHQQAMIENQQTQCTEASQDPHATSDCMHSLSLLKSKTTNNSKQDRKNKRSTESDNECLLSLPHEKDKVMEDSVNVNIQGDDTNGLVELLNVPQSDSILTPLAKHQTT